MSLLNNKQNEAGPGSPASTPLIGSAAGNRSISLKGRVSVIGSAQAKMNSVEIKQLTLKNERAQHVIKHRTAMKREGYPSSSDEVTFSELKKTTECKRDNIGEMEQQLIERAKAGDRQAFQEIVSQSLPNVTGLAFQMLGNQTEAEDLAQDVMLSLWQNIDKYDPEKAKLSTWTYRITANRCLDKLRRRKVDQLDDNYDAPIEATQHSDLFEKQVSTEIGKALDELPERQKLALTLFHYQGHSMQEVSEIMDCSVEAIESLLARGRRGLKSSLKPLWQHVREDD
ncbi:MAG: hypothetical protein DHS20C08_03090 [Rhodomicrobium sp.]|nr:MAG: hypothetical protein DHS20C08_03090 [Rhodomicrobium sp.]